MLARLHRPVLLVGPSADLDGSPVDGPVTVLVDGSEVAEEMTRPATEWATMFDQPLLLVQAFPTGGPGPTAATEDARDGAGAHSYLVDLTSRLQHETDLSVTWKSIPSREHNPSWSIVDALREQQASLVTMATHGRTGVDRLVAGSVTMRVVHDAPCPVLVARSRGRGATA